MFAPHNLLKDPPFSNLDLLSCRNLLIYMQREMQVRILDLFHYALRPTGILFVGPSESVEQVGDLFATVDQTHGLYRRRTIASEQRDVPTLPLIRPDPEGPDRPDLETPEETVSYEDLHQSLRGAYAPPSLLVDAEYELLHVSEGAQRFLKHPTGEPTTEVLRLIRSGLRMDLRTALFQVFRTDDEATEEEVRQVQVQRGEEPEPVRLRVRRVEDTGTGTVALIVLEEQAPVRAPAMEADGEAAERIEQLKEELDQTKEQLARTIEEYETQTQDLRASNEELQSMNEELKSTTEELETSKEELQSVNEELITVNDELQTKNEELTQANSDLKNLMTSTGIGVIFLDRELQLRRYTPPAEDLFNFIPADEGRPLSDLRGKIDYDEAVSLAEDAERVLDAYEPMEREIQGDEEQWYLVRLLPYRTENGEVDGVVITFIDINDRKRTELQLREREAELRELNESLETEVQERTRKVRELSSELAIAEQEERDRISDVLHNELQQELHAVQMWVKAIEPETVPDETADLLDQMHETLASALERTRTLAADLSPPVLETKSFVDIMEWLALHMENNHGLSVAVDSHGSCRVPQRETRILLFRLVRELLFNLVKHAEVDEARLRCRRPTDEQVVVEVIDEGKGFDVEGLDGDRTDGFGLYSVRERLDMLGGHLELNAAPGEGTQATLVLPTDDADTDR